MIAEFFRVASFLLPVPFMALFFVKTDKLNFLKTNPFPAFIVLVFLQIVFGTLGYVFPLVIAYTSLVLLGTSIFSSKGWTMPQALSLSFCLTYFGSFFWELPTHIYTIIVRGGVDGAFPLHLLFVFPMLLVYEKIKTNRTREDVFLRASRLLLFSVLVLAGLLVGGYDIWSVPANPLSMQVVEEAVWMANRVIVVIGLFMIYRNSSLRKEVVS